MNKLRIKKNICVCMILLLCLTTSSIQTIADSVPYSDTDTITAPSVNEPVTTSSIEVSDDELSPPASNSDSNQYETTTYTDIASTTSTSSIDPRMPTTDNCVYSLQNVGTDRYASSPDNFLYTESSPNIYQTSNNSTSAQSFRLEDAGDGYFFIIPLECDGSEDRRMCAPLPDYQGFVENVFYAEYSEESEYEFRWRIEFIPTYDVRLDCFAIYLGDSDYVLTAMTDQNGSYDQMGTNPIQAYNLAGNICITSYGYVSHYVNNEYSFDENYQLWSLHSGGQKLYYGYNVRNTGTMDIGTNEINLHISCPVTQYGDTFRLSSSLTSVLNLNNTTGAVLPNMTPGNTVLLAITSGSNGLIKEIMSIAVYVYLPDGTYYFSDPSASYVLSVSTNSQSQLTAYNGDEPTQSSLLYTLHYIGSGKYCIQSNQSSGFIWGISNNNLTLVGIGIVGSYANVADSLKWTIEKSGDGYRIYNISNNYASLTLPTALADGSAPYLSQRSYSNAEQVWSIHRQLGLTGYELSYAPAAWNDPITQNQDLESHIQYKTNCYSYAYNNQTLYKLWHSSLGEDGFFDPEGMQPGALGKVILNGSIESTADLLSLLEYDKAADDGITLIPVRPNTSCPQGGYKVALWYDIDDRDYHWYRQNPDGTWSHKPGDYPVTNLDTHGNLIVNAAKLNTFYSTFVGYYYAVPYNIISPIETAPTVDIDVLYFYPEDFD